MQVHSAVIAGVAIVITGDFRKSWKYPGANLQAHTSVSRFSYQAKRANFRAVTITVASATPTA